VARSLVPVVARRKVLGYLHGQGLGRRAREAVEAHGVADLRAVLTMLGDKPFFLGGEPSGVDATAYAFLEGTRRFPIPSRLREEATGSAALNAYCDRMAARFGAPGD
jgi:glutathione S-transferase